MYLPLMGLPPSSSGFFHLSVTELLSYFVISRFFGSLGGSAGKQFCCYFSLIFLAFSDCSCNSTGTI